MLSFAIYFIKDKQYMLKAARIIQRNKKMSFFPKFCQNKQLSLSYEKYIKQRTTVKQIIIFNRSLLIHLVKTFIQVKNNHSSHFSMSSQLYIRFLSYFNAIKIIINLNCNKKEYSKIQKDYTEITIQIKQTLIFDEQMCDQIKYYFSQFLLTLDFYLTIYFQILQFDQVTTQKLIISEHIFNVIKQISNLNMKIKNISNI
ncbi:unnamed protein product [Paramecium octaurelia]|uniref:Uncharacterized protein n=1 Tax=Paramecium octaurelia TaxID=43137 RepID=A0A8S1S3M2_PAROT|nr:unnamed protein product [Paramecium octaurelia]